MSASTDLTTLDAMKEHLHIADTDEDALLTALINSGSEAIEHFTGRIFGSDTFTEYYDGGGKDTIALRHVPVISVTSVHDDLNREYGGSDLVDSDSYTVDNDAGLIRLDSGTFADGNQNVKVIYTAGYEAVPKDVALACRLLVAATWQRAKRRNSGLKKESAAGHSLVYENGMPTAVRELLAPYLLPTI